MRIIFDVKDEPTNDVYAGQVRKDEFGVFAIVAKGESADKPFNAYLFTENVDDDLYGVINWREGSSFTSNIILILFVLLDRFSVNEFYREPIKEDE